MSAASPTQMRNLKRHQAHFSMLARGDEPTTRTLLAEPTDAFVKAVSTATRLLKSKGKLRAGPGHKNRVAKLTSRTAAIKTKRALMQSAARTQRGRGFFEDLGKGLGAAAPMAALAFL